jgi:hypothetical protein
VLFHCRPEIPSVFDVEPASMHATAATQDVSKIDLELNIHALDLNNTLLKTRSSKDK